LFPYIRERITFKIAKVRMIRPITNPKVLILKRNISKATLRVPNTLLTIPFKKESTIAKRIRITMKSIDY